MSLTHRELSLWPYLIEAVGAAFDENVPTSVVVPPALQVHHLHAVQVDVGALQRIEQTLLKLMDDALLIRTK